MRGLHVSSLVIVRLIQLKHLNTFKPGRQNCIRLENTF